jgi:outer membrane protein assembly complex protein YaeT
MPIQAVAAAAVVTVVVGLLGLMLPARPALAVPVDELDVGRDWRLSKLSLRGTDAVSRRALRAEMLTRTRPWYTFWRAHPIFDPVTFAADLERLRHHYRRRGYYRARVTHDIEAEPDRDAVVAVVSIDEGPPVRVTAVDVTFGGDEPGGAAAARLRAGLPLAPGQVFTEDAYNEAVAYLRRDYRERSYARVQVEKHAAIDVAAGSAAVTYRVESGPPCVFGDVADVEIAGTEAVDPTIVRREIAFESGETFDERLLARTRRNLENLKLFGSVGITEVATDERIDLRIQVKEQPPREVRLGVGFDTEELLRGSAAWTHYNFLGGARQLQFSIRASTLQRTITAGILQPHFPLHDSRTNVLFSQGQQDEEPFTLERTRVSPRIDWYVTPALTAFVFHRFEYFELRDVNDLIPAVLPGVAPGSGVLSGLGAGLDWNALDDPVNPTRGWAATASVEPVGEFLGGDSSFVRLQWEGRGYRPLVGRLTGAVRLRLGTADPVGSSQEIPIFERFFSGGLNSVRGYGRWRIGPIIGDPVGGRTRVEFTTELRHPITKSVAAVAFVDGGQVSVRSYDFPFDELQYGFGVGARYVSPIGPVGLDVGFPDDPPSGDAPWQIHVSLGALF